MNNIKVYSTPFATKINYIVENVINYNEEPTKLQTLEKALNEKSSTISNWLFGSRMPIKANKLALADKIGVSYDYLFDDNIKVEDCSKIEIFYDKDTDKYLLPYIEEQDIFALKNKNIFPITKRFPVMFPNFDSLVAKYGKNIYITNLKSATFPPYSNTGSFIIYAENVILEHFKFFILNNNGKLKIVRGIEENGSFWLEYHNKKEKLETVKYDSSHDLSSVLLIITEYLSSKNDKSS